MAHYMDLCLITNKEGKSHLSLLKKKKKSFYFLVYADSANPSDLLINGFKVHFIVNT